MRSASKATRRRRNLQNPKRAKANWFYSSSEVLTLYEVCRNTLANWIKQGLPFFERDSQKLFRGDVLNAFHQKRLEIRKRPCGPYEIYCVPCDGKHSLLKGSITTHEGRTGLIRVCLPCPETNGSASRWMDRKHWEEIKQIRSANPNDQTPD